MRKILFLAFLFFCSTTLGQSKSPRCFGTDTSQWNECIGTYTLPDGSKYVGTWIDGNYNGRGVQTFPNGNRYEGEFRDGKRHGTGTYSFANQDKYVGEFRYGRREGQGSYTVYGGSRYTSTFRNDKPEGKGIETTSNGAERVGIWQEEIFVTVVTSTRAGKSIDPTTLAQRAKQGNAEAQYQYGMQFINGTGDDVKPRIAIEWLLKAQSQGHEGAKKQIASMFDFGIQMSNFASAIKVYD